MCGRHSGAAATGHHQLLHTLTGAALSLPAALALTGSTWFGIKLFLHN